MSDRRGNALKTILQLMCQLLWVCETFFLFLCCSCTLLLNIAKIIIYIPRNRATSSVVYGCIALSNIQYAYDWVLLVTCHETQECSKQELSIFTTWTGHSSHTNTPLEEDMNCIVFVIFCVLCNWVLLMFLRLNLQFVMPLFMLCLPFKLVIFQWYAK